MKNVELEKKNIANLSTRLPNDHFKYGTRQFASEGRDLGYAGVTTIPDNGVRIDWNSFR